MTPATISPRPPRILLLAAFAAVYVIWGSTYLAIRVGVETLPPFLMGGVRYFLAGGLLLILLRWREVAWPSRRQVRNATVAGAIMLVGGNGLVAWAEQEVPSSLAALFIASTPVWFAAFDWLRPGGQRPFWTVWLGIIVGLAGVAGLVWQGDGSAAIIGLSGALALLAATICWSGGSMLARHTDRPESPWMAAALQMLSGGAAMLLLSPMVGELRGFQLQAVSARSLFALIYLLIFGSWVAFSAYVWLLEVTTPARVSTYAYVNPIIAVFLGWALLGERVTPRMLAAAAVIIVAVVILTWPRPNRG